ncbi:hypothetical protein L1887_12760 [Cichorium endivia]|nr:hypothetical protein L1887_12760 [Cichorium endivia]
MSIKVVDCFEDGKVRYILQFSNSTYGKGMSFYPLTSFVAEGVWDKKKNRLELVACQLFDKTSPRGCSIRLFDQNLGYVSIYSPANMNSRIKGATYKYSNHEKVTNLCSKTLDANKKGKKETYPDEKSPNLRFDMLLKNKKGQMAYSYASPLYIGNQ